jgi:hypothetical protein
VCGDGSGGDDQRCRTAERPDLFGPPGAAEPAAADLASFRSERMVLGVLGEPEYFSDDDEIQTSVGAEEVREGG